MPLNKVENSVKEQDLILVHIDEQPAFFARVEGFTADQKPKWWHVKLLVLNVPLQITSWILRLEQLNGELFTMQGTSIRIEKVVAPAENAEKPDLKVEQSSPASPSENKKTSHIEMPNQTQRQARILSFDGQKKVD